MATFRNLQSDRATWLSVDPQAESLYSMSPYQAMFNNPISFADPEGDFPWVAVGIAAALQGVGGGINSANDGGSFFGGFAKGALIGGATSAATFGIGSVFGSVGGIGTELARAGAHGAVGGLSSVANGGSFASGFLGSAVSSGFGSALSGASGFNLYAGSALAGGVTNAATGGNFFIGAGQGLGIAALNHSLHNGDCPDCIKRRLNNVTITATRLPKPGLGAISAAASIFGSISSSVGYINYNNGQWLGANGKYNSTTWGGNGATGGRSVAQSTSNIWKQGARGFGYFNYGAIGYQRATGQISAGQAIMETLSNSVTTFAPPIVSVPWTAGWEGTRIASRTGWYHRNIRQPVRRLLGIKR